MRPHPKIRKTVKWGGAAASLLLAVVWVGSAWWWVGYASMSGRRAQVLYGRLMLWWPESPLYKPTKVGWHCESMPPRLWWHFGWERGYGRTTLHVPLWALLVPSVSVTASAWWMDRRKRRWALAGSCPKCGYDRAGIAAGAVCPECGAGAVKEVLNAKGAKGSKT